MDEQSVENRNQFNEKEYFGEGGADFDEGLSVLRQTLEIGLRHKSRRVFLHPGSGYMPDEVALEPLPEKGTKLEELLEEVETMYLPGMPNFGSKSFFGFPDSGNSLSGMAGAILAELLNVNLINSTFCSRIATEMEIAVIRWLREVVGYYVDKSTPESAMEVGGVAVTGGTMANYAAVLLARENAFPHTMETGVNCNPSDLAIVIPQGIAHYTIAASMAWAGLGSENIISAPVKNFKYDRDELPNVLKKLKDEGRTVIMGVVYAGDSRSMTIENFQGTYDIFRKEAPNAWLHCDGCHGTSLLFSNKYASKLDGITLFDSITLDPHKVLTVPYPTSILLTKDTKAMKNIRTKSDLIMRQSRSLGQATPALGSKSFFSLRLWMLFKTLGREGIGELIERRLEQAEAFENFVAFHPRFIQINERNINSVIFIYIPEGFSLPLNLEEREYVSLLNRKIYEKILADGNVYVHSFVIADSSCIVSEDLTFEFNVLRYMAGNPLIDEEDMLMVLELIEQFGNQEHAERSPK